MTGSATYNIHDDRLKLWLDERLSDTDYERAKKAGFVWWRGSKCFTCVWRPQAEDLIDELGIAIECIAESDDVEARVDRFSRYADKAEETAERAAERLESGAANTARRQRLAEGVAAREFSSAAHWASRIAGAIRHAQFKERPDVIVRRINTLEAELRKHQRGQKLEAHHYSDPSKLPRLMAWHKRFADHIEHRLEYERARLAATGHTLAKIASNEIVVEKGGAVRLVGRYVSHPGWYYVTKLNPSSVEVWSPHETHRTKWRKVPRDEIMEVASPADVEAGKVQCAKPEEQKPSSQPKGVAKARDGKTPEKFGAFGASGGFVDRITDCRWYLITKVNRTTVEYMSKEIVQTSAGMSPRFYIHKTDIRGISFLKSAAEVQAQHPDLLADWKAVEEIRARRAAKQQEAAA